MDINVCVEEVILDEGVGVNDNGRKLNIETANDDIAKSTDVRIIEALEMNDAPKKSLKIS